MSAVYDVYQEKCPSRRVLEIISDKWTILIIKKLAESTHRFGELQRAIGGISKKVLTQTLRDLERSGLIHREVFPEITLKVEYSLTDLGRNISQIFATITQWAEQHIEQITVAQQRYDSAA